MAKKKAKKEDVKDEVAETKEDVKKSVYRRLGYKTKASVKKFDNELRRALNTALIAAFGFIIALTWRDLITAYVNTLSKVSYLQGQWISTLIVTLVCVIGIILVTNFIKFKEEEKKS